jgi:hypothetical protein
MWPLPVGEVCTLPVEIRTAPFSQYGWVGFKAGMVLIAVRVIGWTVSLAEKA